MNYMTLYEKDKAAAQIERGVEGNRPGWHFTIIGIALLTLSGIAFLIG